MHNLTLLSEAEKNRIELDKQAAYAVWQVKNGKKGYEVFAEIANGVDDDDEREFFERAVSKYKIQMGMA
ncbi:DUF3283 family protein [Photobacterium aphoticum]|uniref:Pyridoxamine 5-phosphate oxidase n=1 Tax=Photobacterium aphoticum TaxID=754436 RepID=A0A090R9L1_9GAMM|nr:DUF3283 family protein [Photobacterium aphoticum]KLU99155.1 pyridoxamine 5-phosphate oxidase [Photobacterium aphoticum]PSU59057.1 DUF3283 domain-containing protein [Photobacterium aphoticum]GAL04292.1 hypothetical protein JCM19237_964 [Photobacterium aphoticum]GHA45167.1 pyridoxamine 5'-phosphate oxidase [Photobacterium aphoticum]